MKKSTIILLAGCFLLGMASAVFIRLHHGSHGGDHSNHTPTLPQTTFELINEPMLPITAANTAATPDETKKQTLAQHNADYLLVNFWATWCAPCLAEMPLLQQAARQHGITTIGISYEESAPIRAFLARHPVSYNIYKSSFDIFYFFQQHGNTTGVLPYTVLLDKSGKVLATRAGDFKSAEEIVEFTQKAI